MLGRDNKPNFPGGYFHAYNRGVKKDTIFLDDSDYRNFLYRAKILLGIVPPPKRSAKGGIRLTVLPKGMLEVLSYCLMPNHFHFLVRQQHKDGMKIFFHRLCTSYSSYFNRKYNRVGHVFQDIFKCKNILDDGYLTHLTAYIHLNPAKPFSWEYSSLPAYLGLVNDGFTNPRMLMEMHKLTLETYKNFLLTQYDSSLLEATDLLFDDDDDDENSVKVAP